MKTKFEAGIVGTSNDALGDEFLMRMEARKQMEEWARADKMQSEIKYMRAILLHLVNKAGGKIEINHGVFLAEAAVDLFVSIDHSTQAIILQTRPKA